MIRYKSIGRGVVKVKMLAENFEKKVHLTMQ